MRGLNIVRMVLDDLKLDPVDVEASRRRMLISIIFTIGFVFLVPFGMFTMFRGIRILGGIVLANAVMVVLVYIQYRMFRNYRTTATVYLAFIGLVFGYLVATGGISHTGPLWIYTFPAFSLSLLGMYAGTGAIVLFAAALGVIMWVPGIPFVSETYQPDYRARLLFSYFALSLITFFTEYIRHHTQGALARKNRQLGEAMADLRDTQHHLTVRTRELERSNRELVDFAHIASHDLQEPLRKVTAFGDRLADRAGDALDDRGRDYLARMQNAAGRMSGLLNGLLGYARVTTKGNPFKTVDMAKVTADVLGDLEVRINETGGRVETESPGTVKADPLQMRQLIQNLVGNALKYHKPDVPPVVKVAARITENGAWYELTVADNGIGIADEDKDKAFGIFQRLVGKSDYEGTGVGLAICKKIAERHGGSITLRGEPGVGTTFTVRLPVRHDGEDGDA